MMLAYKHLNDFENDDGNERRKENTERMTTALA